MASLSPSVFSRGAQDLLQFSIDTAANLHKKLNIEGQFKDFEDAFRNIQVCVHCGRQKLEIFRRQ